MIRWLLWKGPTRSHSELGRETFLRQWYFSLSCGRVGNCRIFDKHDFVILLIHCVMASPSKVKHIDSRLFYKRVLFIIPLLLFLNWVHACVRNIFICKRRCKSFRPLMKPVNVFLSYSALPILKTYKAALKIYIKCLMDMWFFLPWLYELRVCRTSMPVRLA